MGNFPSIVSNVSTKSNVIPLKEEVKNIIEKNDSYDLEKCLRRTKRSASKGESKTKCEVNYEDTIEALEQLGYTVTNIDLEKEKRQRKELRIPYCPPPPRPWNHYIPRNPNPIEYNTIVSWEEQKPEGIFNGYQFTASRARTFERSFHMRRMLISCMNKLADGQPISSLLSFTTL